MSIRAYQPADAEALALLVYDSVRALGPRRYSLEQTIAWAPAPADPARIHARCTDGRTVLIHQPQGGPILAYAELEADGHVDQLYAHPDVAGAGVAGALLSHLIALADARGYERLYTEASELARGLFERHGFAVLHRRDFEHRGVMIWNWAMVRGRP